jgi:phosphoribosylanthranilate isomerase
MAWVKICGIQDITSAKIAESAGADAIGLMFANSPRKITAAQAKKITQCLGKAMLKIGVFVDEKPHVINALVDDCHLDMVQLHGEEPPEYLATIKVPVIKAFRIEDESDLSALSAYSPFAFLLDSKVAGTRGGTGHSFDWRLLENSGVNGKIVVAGGLTVDNVISALSMTRAFGVDVSSGVETGGQKDEAKIRLFVQRAKEIPGC